MNNNFYFNLNSNLMSAVPNNHISKHIANIFNTANTCTHNNISTSKMIGNSTPNNLNKSKNKENFISKKKVNTHTVTANASATSIAKNSKFPEHSISPNFHLKRKFDQIENYGLKEDLASQTNYIIYKVDEFYDKFSSKIFGREWKEEFLFELKQENIVDISDILPKSLNTRGSHLLEYTKFWILFIEYKFSELDLEECLMIFNNAMMYDLNDYHLLHEYFVNILEENFEREEIFAVLEKKNGFNHFRVPEKLEQLTKEYYRFLLDKPDVFKDSKTVKNLSFALTPIPSKAQKIINELHNFNSNSNKGKLNSNSNQKLSSLNKERNIASVFELCERKLEKENSQLKNEEKVIDGQDNKRTTSQGVNTENVETLENNFKNPEKNSFYKELIQRNKLELIIENVSEIDFIGEVNIGLSDQIDTAPLITKDNFAREERNEIIIDNQNKTEVETVKEEIPVIKDEERAPESKSDDKSSNLKSEQETRNLKENKKKNNHKKRKKKH
jgi:hypothetical protein